VCAGRPFRSRRGSRSSTPAAARYALADDRERGAVAVVELPYRTLDQEAGA
jgi:hypothetical protein